MMDLQHPPEQVVQRLLIAIGVVADPLVRDSANRPSGAWPAYYSTEPSDPDNCVTVYDTTWVMDARTMVDGEVLYHYGIQVRVRSAVKSDGAVKAEQLRSAITKGINAAQVAVGSNVYVVHCFAKTNGVLYIGKETTTKRTIHTVNTTVALRIVS